MKLPTKIDWFMQYINFVLFAEGKFSNNKVDRGGKTYWGITEKTLKNIGWVGDPPDKEQAIEIYRKYYWLGYRCDEMHPFVAWCAIDGYVQHPTRSVHLMLQQALGVTIDGQIGPKTMAAAKNPNILLFWKGYRLARVRFYNDIVESDASQFEFLDGWHERLHLLLENMYLAGLVQQSTGKVATIASSSTTKAIATGSALGIFVGILQFFNIDVSNWQELLVNAGVPASLVTIAATWIGKHTFKDGNDNGN